MFDFHDIEKIFKDIDIEDEAFLHLFDFFDKWRWHLDTRITASGKDINPDVLGYVFEQYINDRAQMGAYYTKEDITEYIGKNCILPYLFDAVKKTSSSKDFREDGYIWQTLQHSGDAYIYDAVKHGYSRDWLSRIPAEIAEGVDTSEPQLLVRRSHWIRFDSRINGNIYEYHISKSKPIIDEIDKLLAKHYGFTEEELDFIINYDIKYRMGDELNKDEE